MRTRLSDLEIFVSVARLKLLSVIDSIEALTADWARVHPFLAYAFEFVTVLLVSNITYASKRTVILPALPHEDCTTEDILLLF